MDIVITTYKNTEFEKMERFLNWVLAQVYREEYESEDYMRAQSFLESPKWLVKLFKEPFLNLTLERLTRKEKFESENCMHKRTCPGTEWLIKIFEAMLRERTLQEAKAEKFASKNRLVYPAYYGYSKWLAKLLEYEKEVNGFIPIWQTPTVLYEMDSVPIGCNTDENASDLYAPVYTALTLAVKRNHLENVRILLDAGAQVNFEGRLYHGALQLAAMRGNEDMICLLHAAGVKPKQDEDPHHLPELSIAAMNGDVKLGSLLLGCGAPLNGRYQSPLRKLVNMPNWYDSHQDFCIFLIGNGADISQEAIGCDPYGRLPELRNIQRLFLNMQVLHHPKSLKQTARRELRKHLVKLHPKENLFSVVPRFDNELPRHLKSYLLYEFSAIKKPI